MLDMTLEQKDKQYFITDIEVIDGNIVVTRADGSKSTEKYSEHNLGFYRMQMIKNAKENINSFMDDLSKDSFMTFVKRYAAIIGGIVGLYFMYNFDIHIAIKIILTILVLLGEAGYYLYNELYLSVIGSEVIEGLATEYYLKNLDIFKYDDKEAFTDGYVVPPEDIGKCNLTQDMLEQIKTNIEHFESEGIPKSDMSMTYKRNKY